MPYKLVQSGSGYTVVNSETGRKHSRRPLPRKRAVAQMRALYAAENKDAGTTAGPALSGPGGLLGVPGMGRKWGNRQKRKDCTCGLTTKEQIVPGVTRIRGNLCNVHGRYGPCDPSKRSVPRKPTGRARKPRKVAAPKKTPEQRRQEVQARRVAREAERQKKAAERARKQAQARKKPKRAETRQEPERRAKPRVAPRADTPAPKREAQAAPRRAETARAPEAKPKKITPQRQSSKRPEIQRPSKKRGRFDRSNVATRTKAEMYGGVKRSELDDSVFAGPDRSFPIKTAQDVKDAVQSLGRTKHDKALVKRGIIRRARAIGATDALPESWRSEKSFAVYKSATGDLRWIARTTTAYRDRDDEIITTAALDRDSQRMTATKQFGPLRFWHLGRPDPLNPSEPWGEGVDIGDCDYSVQIGTSRVESGTFRDPIIAQRVAATADDYELSPGFFHPIDQPNARREYEDIRTFERSLVPTKYGRASNLFTGITVKEFRMDIAEQERRFKAAIEQLQLTPEQATALASGLVQADKSAQAQGVAYKSAPEEVTIGGLTYTLKAPKPEPEEEDDEVDDGEGGDEEAIAYLGDMEPGEFWAEMKSALAPAMRMGEMLKAMEGHMAEMKALYGGATTKSTTDTAEIAALKSQIAEASARLARLEGDQPAVVNSADVEAALKGAPQAPPDPNAPVVPDDPNRPYAAIGARTFPSLYSTNPDGTFAGWNTTPSAQVN